MTHRGGLLIRQQVRLAQRADAVCSRNRRLIHLGAAAGLDGAHTHACGFAAIQLRPLPPGPRHVVDA